MASYQTPGADSVTAERLPLVAVGPFTAMPHDSCRPTSCLILPNAPPRLAPDHGLPARPLPSQVSFIRNDRGKVVFDRRFNTASMLSMWVGQEKGAEGGQRINSTSRGHGGGVWAPRCMTLAAAGMLHGSAGTNYMRTCIPTGLNACVGCAVSSTHIVAPMRPSICWFPPCPPPRPLPRYYDGQLDSISQRISWNPNDPNVLSLSMPQVGQRGERGPAVGEANRDYESGSHVSTAIAGTEVPCRTTAVDARQDAARLGSFLAWCTAHATDKSLRPTRPACWNKLYDRCRHARAGPRNHLQPCTLLPHVCHTGGW